MANKKNKVVSRKRKFRGGGGAGSRGDLSKPVAIESNKSRSAKKIKPNLEYADQQKDSFFFMMNFLQLKSLFQDYAACCLCGGTLELENDEENRMGFSISIIVNCVDCDFKRNVHSSPEVSQPTQPGINPKEVNLRAAMAFREIGRGHASMITFNSVMNMPSPMTKNNFNAINKKLFDAYEKVALKSMSNAAVEVRESLKPGNKPEDIIDCGVSIDGTWQRRGYASLNGVVAAVSHANQKVIDTSVLSKFCKSCQVWEKHKGTLKYDQWRADHSCLVNHNGSAGSMESAGAIQIFSSSIDQYNLRYSQYLGDGDTGSFNKVVDAKPYGDSLVPVKLECVGHYQKRTGTRLREKRNKVKSQLSDGNKKLSDGKGISGKGRLTDKAINTLQNYVGMAIRQNSGKLLEMRNSVIATLLHCTDFSSESTRHAFCPKGKGSWCKWQSDQVTGENTYKHKVNLPVCIQEKVKPIFQDLANIDMLRKCLHGMTQNSNESFNQLIWNRCPKNIFTSRRIVEMAVNSAVIVYNDGFLSLGTVLESIGLQPGCFFINGARKKNCTRLKNMERKSSEKAKSRRKTLRSIRKGFMDSEKAKEGGQAYSAGNF